MSSATISAAVQIRQGGEQFPFSLRPAGSCRSACVCLLGFVDPGARMQVWSFRFGAFAPIASERRTGTQRSTITQLALLRFPVA
jgi:hypothetical protein